MSKSTSASLRPGGRSYCRAVAWAMWIRASKAYDAVIDFDRALRDPANPSAMRPAYDSGDHLHPNDAGYQAMADAVDLSLFDVRGRGHPATAAKATGVPQARPNAAPCRCPQ